MSVPAREKDLSERSEQIPKKHKGRMALKSGWRVLGRYRTGWYYQLDSYKVEVLIPVCPEIIFVQNYDDTRTVILVKITIKFLNPEQGLRRRVAVTIRKWLCRFVLSDTLLWSNTKVSFIRVERNIQTWNWKVRQVYCKFGLSIFNLWLCCIDVDWNCDFICLHNR